MSYILKIVVVFALVKFYVFQSEASPSHLGVQKFTVAKPTFISTAQFVDRCVATKICTNSNMQAQFVRARISSTTLPSFKVSSMLSENNKNTQRMHRGNKIIDAVKKNDLKSLKKIVANQVDVEERDKSEMTPLHWATEKGHVEAAKILIENHAEIDARDKYFNTPLHIACSHDFSKMIELLIDNGANIYAYNLMKAYPLKLCSTSIDYLGPCLKRAAEKGGKLFYAVESGDLKLVQKLVGQGLNINFENSCGQTALTVAVLNGHKNVAEWLVNNGADVNIESCDGATPLDLAKNAGMSLAPCKTPDWKSIIISARKSVNKWLIDNPPQEEIEAERRRNYHSLTWIAYHQPGDIFNFLKHLCYVNPMICSIREIRDWMKDEGTPLKVLKISNRNPNNKAIWIDGGIHGNEWISTSAVTYIANELIKNWDKPNIQNVNWYILAVHNPDGYEYSYQFDRLWRKNRAPTGQRDFIGVDLNRNYDFEWGKNVGVSNPNDDTYGGTCAFSEHETSTVRDFILETIKGKLSAFISFQSYGQYVLYPSDDNKDVKRVGTEGVKRMKAVDNQNYKIGTALSMFNATSTGSISEWAKSVGIKYSYSVNLRDTGRYGFLLPPSFIEITAKEAQAFVLTVLENISNYFK